MSTRNAIILVLLLIIGLGGCASSRDLVPNPAPAYGRPVVAANPYYYPHRITSPQNGVYGGTCYRGGAIRQDIRQCDGIVAEPLMGMGDVGGSAMVQPTIVMNSLLTNITPQTAQIMLDRLGPYEQSCKRGDTVKNVTVGAAIGAAIGGLLTHDAGIAALGALIGAAGGNSSSQYDCDRHFRLELALRAVIDTNNRCEGLVRNTNGVVTHDELCRFVRPYSPQGRPPQAYDRKVVSAAPAASASRPAAVLSATIPVTRQSQSGDGRLEAFIASGLFSSPPLK